MKLPIRWNLWRKKQELTPRAAFRRALKNRLSSVWETRYGTNPQPWFARYAGAFAAGMVVVLTSTTGAYAYTSPDVTEGTVLYPVKRAIERVEEKTKTTPEAKAAFYLKQIDRREAEKKVLAKQQKKVKKVETEIEKNEESLAEVEQAIVTSTNPGIKAKAHERLEKRKERLEKRQDVLEKQAEDIKKDTQTEGRVKGDKVKRIKYKTDR